MFLPAVAAGLVLGLSQISGVAAQPVDPSNSFIITHSTKDYFPQAKGDMTPFDVDVRYTGYNASTAAWLNSLNPADANSDKEKAITMTEASYAKPFDPNDPDMAEHVNDMLAAMEGQTPALEKRDGSLFTVGAGHAVRWASCAGVFSCLSGTTCSFNLEVNKAPRSECQSQGGSSCCISWSNYNVRVGFFTSTWTTCNDEIEAGGVTDASCQGHGSSSQGGDVCLSNRASGCT